MRLGLWTLAWCGIFEATKWRIAIFNLPPITESQVETVIWTWLIIGSILLIKDIVS